ncbi:MAG: hypothetical protein JSU96_08520 [Acidobacteriota bacterium]|nr:MAG: hypothetical protein JSU96_08520 [Acidobacteriota bacterium]
MTCFRMVILLIGGQLLMTTLLAGLPSRVHEFAQVAEGGDANLWMRTSILVRNHAMREANITVKFFDDSGTAWEVKIGEDTASTHTAKIPADGMVKLMTAGQGAVLKAGWATLTADREVSAQLFFEIFSAGKLTTQAAVEPVGSVRAAELFVDIDTAVGQRTALAVASLTSVAPVHVTVTLTDESGGNVWAGDLVVPPSGHVSKFVDEIIMDTQLEKYRGIVSLRSDGPITVTALQQTGLIIGTLSALRRTLVARRGGEQ